jgi:hypothetical protein
VFALLHTPPSLHGFNRTTWRLRDLHAEMAELDMPITQRYISRIIKDAGYRYRKARKVLTSTDPEYREKLKAITDILSKLKPNEKFFSVNEFGPFAVKERGGRSLVPRGCIRTIPQRQKSKGRLIVTAALELSSNQITHFYSKKKNTSEMIKLLDVLVAKYSEAMRIYFSWDAASWHASKALYAHVGVINNSRTVRVPQVELAPLPCCAQFLNVIESVFSGMAKAILHNSNYRSVAECKKAINRHFAERNRSFKVNPKPAGNKIWGRERVEARFSESNNCKDSRYR